MVENQDLTHAIRKLLHKFQKHEYVVIYGRAKCRKCGEGFTNWRNDV